MKDVVMLLDNPLISDMRVEKEAQSLVQAGLSVMIVCRTSTDVPERENRHGIEIE